LRHPSTCNRSLSGFEVRIAADNRSFGIWNVPVIELSAMETPSCDNEAQTTESAAVPDETQRTLRRFRRIGGTISSSRCDAIIHFRLMTAALCLGEPV
jgi:hypothetical protein